MKHVVVMSALLVAMGIWPCGSSATESPTFDPDQPFRQEFSSRMLRALLNQALDVLEDHLEVAGDLSSPQAPGHQEGRLRLKIYPKGKSQSDEHLEAEGWFRFSPDSGQHDLRFRFQQPRDSSPHPRSPADEVL